jgi:type I restriction enzyme M protein
MFHVWRQIMADMGREESHLFTMEEKPHRCVDYVRDNVFAIDFDEKSVRVSRCLNLIAGDGETNVLHLNTLDWTKWDETAKQDDWQSTYAAGWQRLRTMRRPRHQDYRQFQFDVLMANPPFAGEIKQSDMLAPYELAHKKDGKLDKAVDRDLLFIERNLDFLKPGGRMAVVLPQGRFNNSSDQRLREFIMERCRVLAVVGLNPNTFKPHTGTKTSVLCVQKWNDDASAGPLCKKQDDYDIFFATQQVESVDNSGRKVYRRNTDGKLLRDSHGHFIVEHDLFRHDAMTPEGDGTVIPGIHRHDEIAEILAHRPEACLPMSRNLNSIGSRQLLPPKSPKWRPPYTGAARIGALPVGAMQNPARRNGANRNQKSACGCRVPIAFEMAAVSRLRANCGHP